MIETLPTQAGRYRLNLSRRGAEPREYTASYNPATSHWLAEGHASNIGWSAHITPLDDPDKNEWTIESAELLSDEAPEA